MKLDLKEKKGSVIAIAVIVVTLFSSKKIWDHQKLKITAIKSNVRTYEKMIELASVINISLKEIEKFSDLSWSTRETVAIMGKVNELATKYEVEITTFDPAGRRETPNYVAISMNMNIEADYFGLIRFLSAIEKLGQLTKITGLRISAMPNSGSQDSDPVTRAFVSLDAYVLKDFKK